VISLVKVLVSAVVILLVNVVSQRNPVLGGWVASLPIITFLSVLWLLADHKQPADIAQFMGGVLLGLVPTAVLLGVFTLALQRGLAVPWAALSGLLIWALVVLTARSVGLLGR
jgi:F0F1-type ATP synthase assembly protein I